MAQTQLLEKIQSIYWDDVGSTFRPVAFYTCAELRIRLSAEVFEQKVQNFRSDLFSIKKLYLLYILECYTMVPS